MLGEDNEIAKSRTSNARSTGQAVLEERRTTMKKFLFTAIVGFGLAAASANAQVYVRIGPPPVVVEHPGRAPGPNYIWVHGYHRWDGRAYVWVPGRYIVRPRAHAVWVDGSWRHGSRGYYWVEGHWRG
jgi:hypothetical protein